MSCPEKSRHSFSASVCLFVLPTLVLTGTGGCYRSLETGVEPVSQSRPASEKEATVRSGPQEEATVPSGPQEEAVETPNVQTQPPPGSRRAADDPLTAALAENQGDLHAALKAVARTVQKNDSGEVVMVNLISTPITDAGLAHLTEFGQLKELYLDGTGITDAGLLHLKAVGALEWLSLSSTRMTDAGLEHLQSLRKLVHLEIEHTDITDAGVSRFQEALPKCKIVR